eukprot:CAMPEP_0169401630 /NCGR_PEP_ID=MMETSP1017-20121227/54636_1 /TAXON_ID=342587 /ORGANISM="Karlodinium micrum, Strain CCMP2283" /LENGTH=351 /DNA_ID=CAMNT_0009507413 /DNA_START=60 /DNA_END=1115 /DNA_ORIENTATION=-
MKISKKISRDRERLAKNAFIRERRKAKFNEQRMSRIRTQRQMRGVSEPEAAGFDAFEAIHKQVNGLASRSASVDVSALLKILRTRLVQNRLSERLLLDLLLNLTASEKWEMAFALESVQGELPIRFKPAHYIAMISACGKSGRWNEAYMIFNKMCNSGLKPDTITYNALLSVLEQSGQYAITFGFALEACAQIGEWQEAENFIEVEMPRKGIKPNDMSFNALVLAYANAMASLSNGGKFKECLDTFQTISAKNLTHQVQTLNLMLEAAHKGGYVDEGLELLLPVLDEFRAGQGPTDRSLYPADVETLENLERLLQVRASEDRFASHLDGIRNQVRSSEVEVNAQADADGDL